jgi:signal transduction histidine kinase
MHGGDRSPIPTEATVPARRWPAAVEVAAYFVCGEAVTNVAKYARATHVEIHVQQDETRLVVEITDDGIGGAEQARGSGLRGLTDRVEALGGQLSIDSRAGGGTHLSAQIPLFTAQLGK